MLLAVLGLQLTMMGLLTPVAGFKCSPGNLGMYRLELKTYWDEERFPKQYPQWRPPAQWSKTVGFVHGEDLELFRLGNSVSSGVKQFVETADSQGLEQEFVADSFLDSIFVPPIMQGEGSATSNIFVDGNNTKVSLMTKIVPSPDWFVGVDSLDMCREGEFIQQISFEVDPMDAGTDNGFTFTSPNWPTEPQGVVFKITSNYPAHPAGSFNYPHLENLPTLAVFSFVKVKEYELAGDHHVRSFITTEKEQQHGRRHHKDSSHVYKYDSIVPPPNTQSLEIIDFVPFEETTRLNRGEEDTAQQIQTNQVVATSRSSQEMEERPGRGSQSLISNRGSKNNRGFRSSSSLAGYHESTAPEDFFKKKYKSEYLNKAEDLVIHKTLDAKTRETVLQNLLKSYRKENNRNLNRRRKKKLRRKQRNSKKSKKPRNCSLSSWAEWSVCSKTCGIGEAIRTRTITKHPRNGGEPCPKLKEYKWCGSARNCNNGYFNW